MGFFAEVSQWLDGLLVGYIAGTAEKVAAALAPAVTTLATVYVVGWGYLMAVGKIDEPLGDGILRIARLVGVLGIGLNLWLYNSVLVDTFFSAPAALAAAVAGAQDSITIVDQILFTGGDAAAALMSKGGLLDGNLSFYLAGFFVYGAVGLAAVYTIFLLSLAKVALSVLLAVGPLFIACLLAESSRRFFAAWIGQLANFGLIAVLGTIVVSLLMHLLSAAASSAAALGSGITIADAVRVCLAASLIFLVLRQVMPISSGLTAGVSLSTNHALSHSGIWLARRALLKPT
jgi:type IV secretion system protein VirB6